MRIIKRNRFIKVFSLVLTTSLISLPLSSCFNNGDYHDSNTNNGSVDNSTGQTNVVKKSYVEPAIKDSISSSGDIKVIDINGNNEDKVYMSINEFLTNSFDATKVYDNLNEEMFLKDAYSYLYNIYIENRGIFSFYFNQKSIAKVEKDVDQKQLKLELSISLKIENNRYDKQVFNLDKHSIELDGYDYLILDLVVSKQQPKFIINASNNRYFLGISFDNVKFSLTKSKQYQQDKPQLKTTENDNSNELNPNNNKIEFTYNNFSFTENRYSNLFLTEYTYVSDALDYISALKHEQVQAYYDSLTPLDLQNSIEKGILYNQKLYKEFVVLIDALTTSIGQNDNAQALIKKITPSLALILQELNILPKGDKAYNLLVQLLAENKSLVEIVENNNEILTNIITSLISEDPFVVNLISSLLTKFKVGMNDQEKNNLKEEIHGLLSKFGANNLTFVDPLIDCLLNDGTIFDMLKIVMGNQEIVNLLKGAIGNQFSGVIDFIVELFKNDEINKQLIDLFVDKKVNIINLISSLIGNNQTISSVLNLFVNCEGFTKDNLLEIFNKTIKPLTNGILNNTTIQKNFVADGFNYDKVNQKVTYNYNYEYVFNKEVTIDLSPIKKLIPKSIDLKQLGIDTTSIDNTVDGYKIIQTNKQSGYEWWILSDNDNHKDITDILKQIPDNLIIGINDKITFNYSNSNQKIWLNPTKDVDGKWLFGIQLPYILKINLDAPTMFKNIKQYFGNTVIGENKYNLWNEVGLTIVNILSKVYSASGMLYDYDENKVLNNFNYRNDLYMKNYSFSYSNVDINQETFNSLASNFTLETIKENTDVGSKTFFSKLNDNNMLNKTLISNYENSNLNKQGLLFSYSALNSTYIGNDNNKNIQVDKGVKIRIPFRVILLASNKTLDLTIYLNITNFSNNVFLPFKVKTNNGYSNYFSLTKTNLVIDAVVSTKIIVDIKIKQSLANILF